MGKLAVLRLDGDLAHQGFRVVLDIGDDGYSSDGSVMGHLPPAPHLLTEIHCWQKSYARLEAVTRIITPVGILFNDSIDPVDACKRDANRLAIAFQSWLNADEFRPIDAQLRQQLQPTDIIRILIRTDERSLHQLPWHLWDVIEQYPNAEIAFSSLQFQRIAPSLSRASPDRTHIRHNVPNDDPNAIGNPWAEGSIIEPPSLKILAILGHQDNIDIETDRQRLETLPGASVTFLVEPKRQVLTEQLWAQPWDILFFAGHSQTERTQGSSSLSLAQSMDQTSSSHSVNQPPTQTGSTCHQGRIFINSTDSLTLEELSYGLKQAIARGLQLALFNSCDGLGLAYALEPLNIPQLIVMREPVPDLVAQTFLSYFLQGFSTGKTLYIAERQAREKLQALEGQFPCASWLPILFQQPSVSPLVWPEHQPIVDPEPHSFPQLFSKWRGIGWYIRQQVEKYGTAIAITTLIVTGAVVGLRLTGLMQGVELWAFDRLSTLQPSDGPDSRLLIVEVNEADLQAWGYPLSDEVLTTALKMLEAAKPAVIGLDIFRATPEDPGHQAFLDYVKGSDRLVAVCQHSSSTTQGFAPPPASSHENVGFNDVVIDPDGYIRRHLIVMHPANRSDCATQLSLSLQLALEFLDRQGVAIQTTPNGYIQLDAVQLTPIERELGAYQQVNLTGHQLLLNYRPYQNSLDTIAQTVTLTQLLEGGVSNNAIRDRIVLLGVTAPEPKDDFATPHHPKVRGLIIHAHMVSQLISAVLDDRPLLQFWPAWGVCIWIGAWAATGSVVVVLVSDRPYRLWLKGGIMAILLVLCWLLLLYGKWVPLFPAAIAFISGGIVLKHTSTSIYKFQLQASHVCN